MFWQTLTLLLKQIWRVNFMELWKSKKCQFKKLSENEKFKIKIADQHQMFVTQNTQN